MTGDDFLETLRLLQSAPGWMESGSDGWISPNSEDHLKF